ncbi:unnamed protein product [Somion occarium]|uniref:Acyltransferase n=1 Tax=Somion occarium TaxID=3059160 RepID=A0ABP1CLM1_9APHY
MCSQSNSSNSIRSNIRGHRCIVSVRHHTSPCTLFGYWYLAQHDHAFLLLWHPETVHLEALTVAGHSMSIASHSLSLLHSQMFEFARHNVDSSRYFRSRGLAHVVSVAPEIPTILKDRNVLELPDGNDLFLQLKPSSIHVVPGDIDTNRFCNALSKTLGRFPHAAGRLQRNGDDWKINLTNSSVPVTVTEDTDRDEVIPTEHRHRVVHGDLQAFQVPVSLEGAIMGEDVPLVTFKLTKMKKTGETVLGISWNHVLGDATTLTNLLQTLSQYYQGLPPPPAPTFYRRRWPRPPEGAEGGALYQRYTPHVAKSYPLADVVAKYVAEAQAASMVDFKFTAANLDALRKRASRWTPDDAWHSGESLKLTHQDSLTAYLITLHNRCLDKPIHGLMNMMSYRTRAADENALYRHPGNAANCVYLPTFDLSSSPTLSALARTIRRGIVNARSTEYVEKYLMLNSAAQQDAAKYGKFHIFPGESVALVNSLMGHRRAQMVHFGFPGKSQYYTEISWERMFRVFPANPVKGADGNWEDNTGSVVVAFRVKNELKDKMAAMFHEDMSRLEKGLELDD